MPPTRRRCSEAVGAAERRFGPHPRRDSRRRGDERVGVPAGAAARPPRVRAALRRQGPRPVVLERVLDLERLHFALVLSSVSAVLGGLGFAAYAAANAFADAFVRSRRGAGRGSWTAVNWSEWAPRAAGGAPSASLAGAEMSATEGAEAFERALAADVPCLVVSPTDLAARIAA